MRTSVRTFELICNILAAVGSAVVLSIGHRPWYAWSTLALALGNLWFTRKMSRAAPERLDPAAPGTPPAKHGG